MEITDVREAIDWQANHCEKANAPCTARVIRAELAILEGNSATGRRIANWQGLSLEDALPLRVAAGLHYLFLSGEDKRLEPIYAGLTSDQKAIDALVAEMAEMYDARLMPWLDSPPQTNEAGRSASIIAGLLWLSERLGPCFELNELGASAGVNTMMERYRYDLGGVSVGPERTPMQIRPEWRGSAPPRVPLEITAIRGCDVAPVDISDPVQALRLKSYVWPDATERLARIDAAITLAADNPPDLVSMDAGDFVENCLAAPQKKGVTRAIFHSVMWQYMSVETRDRITAAMEEAGSKATADKPLAWLRLETNRETFRHELRVRYWPGHEEWVQLAEAHPHGAWIEWYE
ncbi:DUF2332 domain-containing protein [Altericroceibacterium spongiae]|uniref:DUF2332 domain-containing protein n=2 Tax=Altericroceibacterium spongiae TaxID=2320269 RepID=A0A420ESG5_9SPHN|nr:DUF2332 domain-containing protein [Altericroceibacterium spongiae]